MSRSWDWCMCGHQRNWHEHYREGTECSREGCTCRAYRRVTWWRTLLHPGGK